MPMKEMRFCSHMSRLVVAPSSAMVILLLVTCAPGKSLAAPQVRQQTKRLHINADQSALEPSFLVMKKQLLLAVKSKNRKFIDDLLSSEVLTGLGSGKGKEAFLEEWQGLEPGSNFWRRIERVLEHGAEYDAEAQEFHAPSVSFEDNHSEFPQAIVWNKAASAFSKADEKARLAGSLYGEQVSIVDPPEKLPVGKNWVKIKRSDGRIVFMKSDDLYSAFDEFAMFKKVKGKWQLTWFGYAVY